MSQATKGSDHSTYKGRWIATIHGRIVAHGGTYKQALQAAQISRHKEVPKVTYVPLDKPMRFSDIITVVRESLPESGKAYLIGGAVRDAMLSRPIKDYDFLLSSEVFQTARRIADKIGGAYYPLDEERGAARVVYIDSMGERYILDFVITQAANLEADLRGRDFTINAMAVDLEEPQQLLDPLSGAADLWRKTIRACSPSALRDDPIRVMRAVRIAAGFGFHINPETRALMTKAAGMLNEVSPERIRDELFRILGGPKPHTSIRALDILGVITTILPELSALKSVSQSAPHIKDAFEHSLDTLKYLESLLDFLTQRHQQEQASNLITGVYQLYLGKFRQQIRDHVQMNLLPDRTLRSLIFMAALYHDIAKSKTGYLREDQRIQFIGHESIGAEIVAKRAVGLRLSKKEVDRLRVIVKNHMRPTILAREKGKPSAVAIYQYFRNTGAAGIDICLISLADLLATYGVTLPQERWSRQLEIVHTLMEAWWKNPGKLINPPVLLTGHDIIETFELNPGPQVGELLEKIREAQVSEEVNNQKEAFRYISELLGKNKASCAS
jgi:poly(A) polymerase